MSKIKCQETINESKSKITNELIAKLFEGYSKLKPAAKKKRLDDSDRIFKMASSSKISDFLSLMDSYYLTYLPTYSETLKS